MATTLVVKVIKRVQRIINDKTGIIWPELELLEDFNDAVKDIVLHRPDASTVNNVFDCTASSSKQILPSDALRLVEVTRNINGNVITHIDRSTLNATRPDWHQSESTIAIEHYVYDERDPKTFYLYPRPANNGEDAHQIEIVYSTCPEDIDIDEASIKNGSSDIAIPIDDTYSNAIIDFMLARAYSKDLGSAANANRSARHYQLYSNSLGMKLQSDAMMMKEGS